MIKRSYIIPLFLFFTNMILLGILLLEISGFLAHSYGGAGFFVPFLSFLSFQFIRIQQRRRASVSRGLSILQAINTFTFVFPFIVFFIFIIGII
ncbi:hypothetical protein LF817_02010 [Halobacillus sp. A1]|uniref:hypothetical protein n=1 Tax=Halobacillus sp. A1 TaxID=2880262 RepID=UPI0020A6338F|nr:hypothetical protein [Halobacillus sp. A1]MCP3030110.1 hypothetical protein [Halobacillus sp. A1]